MSSVAAPPPTLQPLHSHGRQAPPLSPASLGEVFGLLDENGDGFLSREEMCNAFEKLGLRFAGEHLDAIMGGGAGSKADGFLCFQDFQALYDSACQEEDDDEEEGEYNGSSGENEERLMNAPIPLPNGQKRTESRGDVWEAFCIYDKNGDGVIDAAELQVVLSNLGFAACDLGFCQKAIHSVDVNSDGVIDFSEFQAMLNMAAH